MKVAIAGPIVKDTVTVDGISATHMGGIPYYEAHVLRSLGIEVEVFITYGKSDEQWVLENFQNIKVHSIYVEKTLENKIFYSKNEPDHRHVPESIYDAGVILPEEKLINELRSFDYIVLGPLYYTNIPYEFFEKLKDKNLIFGNFGLFTYYEGGKMVWKNPESLARVAPFLQYLFLDEKEIKFGAGKDTLEESAQYFLSLGVKNVIVTEGSRGSMIFTPDRVYKIRAFPVKEIVDPTGAGDTYAAGYITALSLFDDIERRGEFAAMVATMVVEKHGAFNGTIQEVLDRIQKHGK